MSKELFVKMTLDAWNAQVNNANKLIDHLSDEQLLKEIAPGRNRGIYLLGHLTAVNDKMLPLLGFAEAKYPHYYDIFAMKADREVAEIPSASEVRKNWANSCVELTTHFKNTNPDQWFEKHTSVSAEDFVKEPHRNRLGVVLSRTGHLQYHLGQMNFLKNKV